MLGCIGICCQVVGGNVIANVDIVWNLGLHDIVVALCIVPPGLIYVSPLRF